jgi:hypothetical protein
MRILIEIDPGKAEDHTSPAVGPSAASDAGPAAEAATATAEEDGGSPSPDLLASVAAAEGTGIGNPADASDAGAAPTL